MSKSKGEAAMTSDKAATDQVKVVFTPSGRQGYVPVGTPVLTAARQLGVDIDSVCGGRAMCGRCQVDVGIGDFAKHGLKSGADHLAAATAVETRYADKRGMKDGRRLSCQAKLLDDTVIDVPPESQVHNQLVRKEADGRSIEMDPIVRLCFVEVREPDMHEPSGHWPSKASIRRRKSPDGSCISGSRTSTKHKRTTGSISMLRPSASLRIS